MLPFGIGFSEVIMIFIVALVVVGPQKLPEIARFFGKGLKIFRQAVDEVKHSAAMNEIRAQAAAAEKAALNMVHSEVEAAAAAARARGRRSCRPRRGSGPSCRRFRRRRRPARAAPRSSSTSPRPTRQRRRRPTSSYASTMRRLSPSACRRR